VFRACPPEGERGRGSGRFEPDGEEDNLAIGVLLGNAQRVERRVHHPHVRAGRFGVEQAAVRARHPHHVPEAGEDHVLLRKRDPVVDASHRNHAHRAARTVHELDVGREQVVDPVLVDRVGVPAADLHELVMAAGLHLRQDLPSDHLAKLRIAELVDESHRAFPARAAIAVPAWTSNRAPGPTPSTSAVSTVL
jgi:hypothetical protein